MIKVVGVRFRNAGKVYFFEPAGFEVKRGTHVIVETSRGVEFGTCVNDPTNVTDDEIVSPLKPILRVATEKDVEQAATNRAKEKEAYKTCAAKIREHELDMKLIDAEYTFDNSKILFYFTADGRIDFRDLVKDLAGAFRTRIELRQVGVRDETKILGGMGICGRPLCCHSYLSDFVPVSIKMAKEQNLSLNPTKISGVCGRLMCCLKNEEEVYEEQNRKLPGVGDYVTTSEGERGVVTNVNIFHETVKVLVQNGDEKELKEYKADDIKFKKHRKRGKIDLTPEEMEQLRAMEPEDVADLGDEIEVVNTTEKEDVVKEEAKVATEKPERNDRPARKDNRNRGHRGGNRDGQNKDGHVKDNQSRDNQPRDNQNKDNPNKDGDNKEGQNRDGQNREGQNKEGRHRDHNKKNWNRNRNRNRNRNKNNDRGDNGGEVKGNNHGESGSN